MNENVMKRILISGGGTGGHIFPAISIANEIKRRNPDAEILFVGAENRMEMEKVPAAGYKIIGLPVCGFDRKHLFKNVKVLFKLLKSMRMARKILKDFSPCMAVGVGGYASGPMLKAAQKMHIPTLIQEQNSYAGVTNKLLAARADAICVAYDGMERFFPQGKIVKTGNPVRRNLIECKLSRDEAVACLGLDPSRRTILVVGGSLGAKTINEGVKAGLELIGKKSDLLQVIWQTGKYYDDDTREALERSGVKNVLRMAFISDMDVAYRAADLVVGRAGASSISELQLLGKPSILVPSPNVAEDHQTKNAMALVDKKAALMIRDADAVNRLAEKMIDTVLDDGMLASLSANVAAMALPDAAGHIVDCMESILKNRK